MERDIAREANRLGAVALSREGTSDENADNDSLLRGEYRPIPAGRRNARADLLQMDEVPRRRRKKRQRSINNDDDVKSQSTAIPRPLNIGAMSSLASKSLPTFDFIFGPEAAELEDKENPILPDELMTTRNDFCYICEAQTNATSSLLQGAPVTEPVEFLVNYIAPLFTSRSINVVIKSIRAYFSTVVRPYMDPKHKQRWTSRQIFFHFFDHTDKYTGALMKQACKDIMIKSIETGISFNPDCPGEERIARDLVPTLVRLYNIIKENV